MPCIVSDRISLGGAYHLLPIGHLVSAQWGGRPHLKHGSSDERTSDVGIWRID